MHQCRQLESQVKACHEVLSSQGSRKCLVQEVFSPPRFAKVALEHGFLGLSYDLKNGYDLSTRADRKRVETALEQNPPELLVLCPPCTHEGGWVHLNRSKGDQLAYLQAAALARSCCRDVFTFACPAVHPGSHSAFACHGGKRRQTTQTMSRNRFQIARSKHRPTHRRFFCMDFVCQRKIYKQQMQGILHLALVV